MLSIYVIHCKRFEKRKANCQSLVKILQSSGHWTEVHVQYMTAFDNFEECKDVILSNDWFQTENPPVYQEHSKALSIREMSNLLKHHQALQTIAKSSPNHYHLVIEDDIHFRSEVVADMLRSALETIDIHRGVTFFGIPAKMDKKDYTQFTFQECNHEFLLACDSYTLTPDTAKRVIEHILPFRFHTPKQFSMLAKVKDIPMLIMAPNVFTDGSKLGATCSSVNPNNICIYNTLFKQIYEILQSPTSTESQIQSIPSLLEKNKFKENPDFRYLEALYHFKAKDLEKSAEIFREAFDMYIEHYGINNSQSTFLINYIRLLKILNRSQPH